MIIESKDQFEKAENIASQIFLRNEFPGLIFKNPDWNLIFVEPWNIFDENIYSTFLSLARDMNEDEFYLAPEYIEGYDFAEYINNINNSSCPVINFNSNLSFTDFDALQKKYHYSRITNAFLYGHTAQWGIYNETNIDMMIIGFNSNLKPVFEKFYKNYPDRIHSLSGILDNLYTWVNPSSEEKVKNEIIANYSNKF